MASLLRLQPYSRFDFFSLFLSSLLSLFPSFDFSLFLFYLLFSSLSEISLSLPLSPPSVFFWGGDISSNAQSLLLVPHSGITPGSA